MACSKKSGGAGLAVGVGLGTALGVSLDNLGVWLPIGVATGLLLTMCSGKEALPLSEEAKKGRT
jgi:hypothetical protein